MTTRIEPSVSFLTKAGELVGFKVRGLSHTELVDDALDAFTKAEAKMTTAIKTIDSQISEEEKEIQEAQKRITAAAQSKDKLTRVLDRVKALTA